MAKRGKKQRGTFGMCVCYLTFEFRSPLCRMCRRLQICPTERAVTAKPMPQCHNPIDELAPSTNSRAIPVPTSKRKVTDSTMVTGLLCLRPVRKSDLYHALCIMTCATAKPRNSVLVSTCATAHACHTSWHDMCPEICMPTPLAEERIKAGINTASTLKILFIVRLVFACKGTTITPHGTITIVKKRPYRRLRIRERETGVMPRKEAI